MIMIISESKIRKIVRNLLKEELSDPTIRAAQAGLALCHFVSRRQTFVCLYDPQIIFRGIESDEIKKHAVIRDSLKAVIELAPADSFDTNGANPITISVAKPNSKMGPAAYECALWIAQKQRFEKVKKDKQGFAETLPGGVTPDRESVSDSAQSVWKNYSSRNDVESYRLDDIDDPVTPNKWDDSFVHKNEHDYLNKSYVLKNEPAKFKELVNNHENFFRTLHQMNTTTSQWYENNLTLYFERESASMFNQYYLD